MIYNRYTSNNKNNTTTKSDTGVTAGGGVSFGDVSGRVEINLGYLKKTDNFLS